MKRLVFIPSEREMAHLLDNPAPVAAGNPFRVYEHGGCWWAICGIGPAAAAMSAALLIAELKPQSVVLAGIGGAFTGSGVAIGQIVQARSERFADLGYRDGERFVTAAAMGLKVLPLRSGELADEFSVEPLDPGMAALDFLTVSTMTSDGERADALFANFGAAVENMEGAAVALACRLHRLPFSQVRAISNWVGPRDPSTWQIAGPLRELAAWLAPRL